MFHANFHVGSAHQWLLMGIQRNLLYVIVQKRLLIILSESIIVLM